jgi:hypothetical protein
MLYTLRGKELVTQKPMNKKKILFADNAFHQTVWGHGDK